MDVVLLQLLLNLNTVTTINYTVNFEHGFSCCELLWGKVSKYMSIFDKKHARRTFINIARISCLMILNWYLFIALSAILCLEIFKSCYPYWDYLQERGFNFGWPKRCQSSLSFNVSDRFVLLEPRMFSQANQLTLFSILSLVDFCQ